MRRSGVAGAICAAFIILTLIVPVVAAQGGGAETLEYYPTPATEAAEDVRNLFNIITGLGLAVFVFVEGLLLYVLWRFRKNKEVPIGETRRGHTRAEIAWTAVPAIILVFVGALSAQTLDTLDTIPEDPDFAVGVEAYSWGWQFLYPEETANVSGGSTGRTLYVEEGSTVRLDITSLDVIHAVWIPEFAIKLDAVPGRINQQWFTAPAPGSYFLQCAEYCGVGHHDMRGEIVVFPKGNGPGGLPYGEPPSDAGALEGNVTVDMENSAYTPQKLTVKPGTTVTWVNRDSIDHTVTPIDTAQWGTEGSGDAPSDWLSGGESWTYTFTEPGEYDYRCIPHSSQNDGVWKGMVGSVTVVEADDGGDAGGAGNESGAGDGGNATTET